LLPPPDPRAELVAFGRELFFNETFQGNGRTCGSCHPATNDFTIDPRFIASLSDDDPLFVAERRPDLLENFENPALMREFGLILENLNGFDDLATDFTMRGVPHTLGLPNTVDSPNGPRTGWSGDGAPGDGSLRSFATGAVIQHFPKTLNRVDGVDFRLPSDEELDALEAFQLSLGRQEELSLPLPLKGTTAKRGQEIFLDATLGKCALCHQNAGANANIPQAGIFGNANFNTGVEVLPDQPQDMVGERIPFDDGFGVPGDSTFNAPSIVEAADTGPFFHNNVIETIEGAVAFYNGDSFNNSPSGQALASLDPDGVGIRLDATQTVQVAAFLRVINALENIRETLGLLRILTEAEFRGGRSRREILERAREETRDTITVLSGGGLHPRAVRDLHEARDLIERGLDGRSTRILVRAMDELERARARLKETP
jgi:hypothetical protein